MPYDKPGEGLGFFGQRHGEHGVRLAEIVVLFPATPVDGRVAVTVPRERFA